MLYLYTQDETGEEKVTLFSMHTHTRTDRCEQNTDAHTHTQDHTLLRGPGLHFTAVCPTSSRSASFHFQQRDGKKMDRARREKRIKLLCLVLVFFFCFFSWLQSEDVNEPEEDKKKKDDKTMDVFWEIRVLTGWDVTPESKTLSGSRAVDLKLRKLKDS